ncbi:DUF2982 domain-containing protein [Pseudidiomarina marina]|uniref:DUF2982 domain-containing protein n=1 Tax=Pseudidiomarina marina TaxID=502366 RepID=A0A432YFJ6_9GAMM|nr:DUF2982 domain-containing protein [Pseudidiomarina marina]PHR63574.1 MAG: hypothetical protein COA51_10110 [Idiomarina sp.]RUO59700.1 DUF2982 domain-containing protein [Pseudidiomarina marina]
MTDTSTEERIVYVKPLTRAHGLGFNALGLVIFAVTMFLWLIDAPIITAAYGLLFIASALLIFLGSAKVFEPPVSMTITPKEITYLHRRGRWQIQWNNILRFDIPRLHRGLELEQMPYIGFRLHDIEPIIQTITPRLAVYLLSEQRHLLVAALRHERPELREYSPYFEVPDRYQSASGIEYRGVQAMFAVRCEHFRELLGYDLFVPAAALDRAPEDFITWLQQLKNTRA